MTVVIALLLALLPSPQAPAPARITYNQIKELFDQIDNQRDRFEDQLDSSVKRAVLRGPSGEVDVERFLDDLQENLDKLKGRYNPTYNAGNEVTTVLRQGTAVQKYMATKAPNLKGASEWNALAGSLGQLAAAYGTSFPLPEDAQLQRVGDVQVTTAASQTAGAADQFRKQLDQALKQDKSIAPDARKAALAEVEGLKKDAEVLANRVKDNKPASGEAAQLIERAHKIAASAESLPLSPNAKSALQSVLRPLNTIAQGFNIPLPK